MTHAASDFHRLTRNDRPFAFDATGNGKRFRRTCPVYSITISIRNVNDRPQLKALSLSQPANQLISPVTRHPGTIVLMIAALTVFMSAPGQSFSVSTFVDPMLDELKLGRTSYSSAYMVATLIGGFTLPFIGRMLDRWGARIVLPIIALGLSLACGWMSTLTTVTGLYVGFTLIRCLGQGSLTLIANWIVGEWFQQYRGRAAGICGVGGTMSVLFIPQLNNYLIIEFGWRNAWLILGAVVAVSLILPAILFLRNRPEDLGLLPDWKRPPSPDSTSHADTEASDKSDPNEKQLPDTQIHRALVDANSFTASEAIRCSAFWKVASVVATVSLVGTGLVFHQVSIVADLGVSRADAISAMGVQAVGATVSTLLAGYLTDRMPVRFILAMSMLFEVVAILLLLNLPGPKWVFAYSAMLGFHGGIIRSAGSIVWINYFGRKHQGSIQGYSMSVMVLAAALGPLPLALCRDYLGGYEVGLYCFLALPTFAGIAVLTAIPPVKTR